MSASFAEFDEIGYWSEIKLEIVRDYASAYSRILNAKKLPHVYIDAFAGAGQHISKGTGEFVPGSPLNALNVRPPFREYHFIDLNSDKVEYLQNLTAGKNDVHIYQGDCNDVLIRQIFPTLEYESYRRALCLLDPYGLDLKLGCDVQGWTARDDRLVPQLSGNGHESERSLAESGQGSSRASAPHDEVLGR